MAAATQGWANWSNSARPAPRNIAASRSTRQITEAGPKTPSRSPNASTRTLFSWASNASRLTASIVMPKSDCFSVHFPPRSSRVPERYSLAAAQCGIRTSPNPSSPTNAKTVVGHVSKPNRIPSAYRDGQKPEYNGCPPVYTRFAGWLLHAKEFFAMCDYSLHSVRTRPAKIGDKLVTRDFGTGTRGFASVADLNIAVCLLPGTELAFAGEVTYADWNVRSLIKARLAVRKGTHHQTAIFRQINKETMTHHDALEFPDGQVVLLTRLSVGQEATILQLPAKARSVEEVKSQARARIPAQTN